MRELWDHQRQTIDALRKTISQGIKRVVCQAPTGAGKTLMAASIVEGALNKDKKISFVVPAISLIDQTLEAFVNEGIPEEYIGVVQADHPLTDWSRPVQLCSISTVRRRLLPEADVVIFDECHVLHDTHKKWMKEPRFKDVPFIGLSATPYTRGLGKYFDTKIVVTTTQELIDKGILSKFITFATGHPNLDGIKTTAGDYNQKELSDRMQSGGLTADIVRTWEQRWGKDKTFLFAVDRAHAQQLQQRFQEDGISAGYQDAETTRGERKQLKEKFHSGEIKVLTNVGTLCLDEKTEILTSTGWVGIDDMTMTHKIAAWDEIGVNFTYPIGIVRRDRKPDEHMVSVDGKVHNIRVTGNHRMLWSSYSWNFKICSAESLVGKVGYIPVSGEALPAEFELVGPNPWHHKKNITALSYKYRKEGKDHGKAKEMSIDYREFQNNNILNMPHALSLDDCTFIGFWLGDGSRNTGSSDKISICQSEKNEKIVEWIDNLISRMGLTYNRMRYDPDVKSLHHSIRWEFCWGRGGRGQQRDGGISYLDDYLMKDGSVLYWGLNKDQFRSLLNGYRMVDGNHGKDGKGNGAGKRIYGTNRKVFDLLQAIGACRGFRIGLRCTRKSTDKWSALHYISWNEQKGAYIGREKLKLEKEFHEERVWCVTSTTGNIITRRGGKVSVVGNTTGVDYDVRCLILARPTKSPSLYQQIIGRALRSSPGKDFAVILDHSDTTSRLGFITDVEAKFDSLDMGDAKAKPFKGENLPKVCPKCGMLRPPKFMSICPSCGFESKPKVSAKLENEGELFEITRDGMLVAPKREGRTELWNFNQRMVFMAELKAFALAKGRKMGWAAYAFKKKFGAWPSDAIAAVPPANEPGVYTKSYCKSLDIAWFNSQRYRDIQNAKKSASTRSEVVGTPVSGVPQE